MTDIVNVESPNTVVEIDETNLEVTMAVAGPQGAAGPQGPAGPEGPAGDPHETYIYNQNVPSSTWDITHNLAAYPAVAIIDSAGNLVVGEIQYVSNNRLIVTFSGSFSGQAFLN